MAWFWIGRFLKWAARLSPRRTALSAPERSSPVAQAVSGGGITADMPPPEAEPRTCGACRRFVRIEGDSGPCVTFGMRVTVGQDARHCRFWNKGGAA